MSSFSYDSQFPVLDVKMSQGMGEAVVSGFFVDSKTVHLPILDLVVLGVCCLVDTLDAAENALDAVEGALSTELLLKMTL